MILCHSAGSEGEECNGWSSDMHFARWRQTKSERYLSEWQYLLNLKRKKTANEYLSVGEHTSQVEGVRLLYRTGENLYLLATGKWQCKLAECVQSP
jgi:hypothetical protein